MATYDHTSGTATASQYQVRQAVLDRLIEADGRRMAKIVCRMANNLEMYAQYHGEPFAGQLSTSPRSDPNLWTAERLERLVDPATGLIYEESRERAISGEDLKIVEKRSYEITFETSER